MTDRERILLSTLRGIQALAYDDRQPARQILDRIRLTCHQTLTEIAK